MNNSLADDIWEVRSKLRVVCDRAENDTKRVLRLAMQTLETAGCMEDRKVIQERDRLLDERYKNAQ